MSHRTKSGQKATRHKRDQRWKRRLKRNKAKLIADGKIKKGVAPVSASANS